MYAIGRNVGRFLLPFAIGWIGLAAMFLLATADVAYPVVVYSSILFLPAAFGWMAERYWRFAASRTVVTAIAVAGVPGLVFRLWFKTHQPFLLPAIVYWGFFSLAGWYLAVRTKS